MSFTDNKCSILSKHVQKQFNHSLFKCNAICGGKYVPLHASPHIVIDSL